MKKKFTYLIIVCLTVPILLVCRESQLIKRESSQVQESIHLMLSGYKHDDVQQSYSQMVPYKNGGSMSLEELHINVTWPVSTELDLWHSIETEILWISPWLHLVKLGHEEAIVRVDLIYDNGCTIPYIFWLRRSNDAWKIRAFRRHNITITEVRECLRSE